MGERGPPKKPREHHERAGTYRADRHGTGRLPVATPDMPPDLSPVAQAAWNTTASHLQHAGLITEIDGAALRLLCESWELYIEACDDVRKNGITVEVVTQAGSNRAVNPAIRVRSDAWKQVYSMLRQFGMTPSARTGLSTAELTDDGDDIAAILGIGAN